MTFHITVGGRSMRLGGIDAVEALKKMIDKHGEHIIAEIKNGKAVDIMIEPGKPYHE